MKNKHNIRKNDKFLCINDVVMEDDDDAKLHTTLTPSEIIALMEEAIQKNTSTTFILPKDVKSSGDNPISYGIVYRKGKKISWIKFLYLKIKSKSYDL